MVTTIESLQYTYFTSGSAAGLLQYVTYRKQVGGGSWIYVKQAAFAYYGASDPNGSVNDLLSVTQQTYDGTSWDDVAVNYYRYYLSGDSRGFVHGLKSHFGPEACRLMFNAGINLSTASDSAIQQYADHIFQYDSSQRVTAETSAVCSSCIGGGTTLDRFAYTTSGNPNDFNSWLTKTEQFLPDSSAKTTYASYTGNVIFQIEVDPTGVNVWCTFYRFDSNGRQILRASPSAVTGYSETYADLVNFTGGSGSLLNQTAGLIEVTNYYSTTGSGAVDGYVSSRGVQQGQTGSQVLVSGYTYSSNTDGDGNTVYPVASQSLYPDDTGTSTAYTTSFAYLYQSGTNQMIQKTTTLPVVTTSQNGSNSADTTIELFDLYGNRTQLTDERGIVSNFTYDVIMSRMLTQVLNVSGGSGPGVNVTTTFTFDDFGRTLTAIGDFHTVVVSGSAVSVQPVMSYAYNQSIQPMSGTWLPDQNQSAKGYYDGTIYTLVDPVTLTNLDKDGRALDSITSHRSASGLLAPGETFAQSAWLTWSSTQYSSSHQTISKRTYFVIPASGTGSLGTNYGETDLAYDLLERRNRQAVWASATLSTITRTVWTTPQREAATWVGTDDTGGTDFSPDGKNSIQFVQAGSEATSGSSVSVALVNNVTVGNTLIAYGSVSGTSAPSSTAVSDSLSNTWTLVTTQAGGSAAAGGAGLWVAKITTGGAATVTFAAGASPCTLAVAEYSGVVATSPVDTSASATSSAGSTTPASGSMTTTNAGDLIFAGASQGNAAVNWTPGSGSIIRTSQGSGSLMTAAIQDQLVTAAGSFDPGFTMDSSQPWTAIAVALKSTAPSSTNNMVQISGNVYDGGSAGEDGNLTQQTLYVSATSGDTRVTSWGFDFRNRKINTTGEVNLYEAYTLDNLDHVTLTQNYNTSATGNLISQSGQNFDARGRVYQDLTYAVDPSTGTVGNVLIGNRWYDPSGNPVQQIAPGAGQVFTKSAFNGVNWVTASYTGYNLSGASYAQAQTVSGDIIIEQAQNTLNEIGNTVSVAAFARLNDATATTPGALTSGNARIMYSASWLDGVDREIASANYGAASSFTRPSTPPASSSTVLVNLTSYDDASRVYQSTDPKSIVNQQTYDNGSRITQTIEDVAGLARTTNYAWTLDNQPATMTAVNPATGDQTTSWAYGTTLADSGAARADLLSSTTYPDTSTIDWNDLTVDQWADMTVEGWARLPVSEINDVTSQTYNRLSEKLTFTDQRGTVLTFVRDKLGRETNDCVTTVGVNTDSAVLQIARTFEVRGMVSGVTSFNTATVGAGSTHVVNDISLTYNTFAQLYREYQEHSGQVNTSTTPFVQYDYDTGSGTTNEIRQNQLTYPNGRTIGNYFGTSGGMNDLLNRVQTIQDTTSGTTDLATYAYLGVGTVVRVTLPEPSVWLDLWGGTSGVFAGLDLFNRIIDQRWQNNITTTPTDIDRYKYGYDQNSNRIWKNNTVGTAAVAAGLDEYYAMDNLNRLTDMQRGVLNGTNTGITGTPSWEMAYGLDTTGNWSTYLTKTTGTTDLNQGRGSNAVNAITNITASGGTPLWVTPAYDAAGNMTTMPQPGAPTSAYTAIYDAWHRMTSISGGGSPVGEYQYDGRSRAIVATNTQTRHFYFTNSWRDIEQRVGSSTSMDQQHVWGIRYVDELICRDDPVNGTIYATQDANFNLTAVCDSSGSFLERFTYDPYGTFTVRNGSWGPATESLSWLYLYQGGKLDTATGLYEFRLRRYMPLLGGWLQRDPVTYGGGMNLYEYLKGSPVSRLDPLGMDSSGTITMPPPLSDPAEALAAAITGARAAIALLQAALIANIWNLVVAGIIAALITCATRGLAICIPILQGCLRNANVTAAKCGPLACPNGFKTLWQAQGGQQACIGRYLDQFRASCWSAFRQCMLKCGFGQQLPQMMVCQPSPCNDLCKPQPVLPVACSDTGSGEGNDSSNPVASTL